MTTTWAYPLDMHPWFRAPSLKRKTLDDDDISIVEYHPRPSISPSQKRRRYDVLEHGIAHLTLNASAEVPRPPEYIQSAPKYSPNYAPAATAAGIPSSPVAWSPHPWEQPLETSVVLPGSIEEPTSPGQAEDLPDIQMKVPSWYEIEKDRIVITDLEDSDTEDQESEVRGRTHPEMVVSPALLDRISKQLLPGSTGEFGDTDASKALVLFRPLVVPQDDSETHAVPVETKEEEAREDMEDIILTDSIPTMDSQAEDAMDIEPL